MSTLGILLGSAATPHTIEHAGRVYFVGRLTEKAKDAFSAWMIARARKLIGMLYSHDEVEHSRRLAELASEVMAGAYDFHDELCLGKVEGAGDSQKITGGVLHTKAGMLALTAILCSCTHEEALTLMVARQVELLHLLELTLAESLPGVKIQARAPAPAQAQAGEPDPNVHRG